MAENTDNEIKDEPAFDPRFQTENLAYEKEKLIACGNCSRMNPPNRLNCMYCGGELELEVIDASSIKTNLRKLEAWERGINIILRETDAINFDANKCATFLSMDAADLSIIVEAGTPLPIARVESEKEADILLAGLEQFGLKCTSIKDDNLAADKPPVRLSGIEISHERLELKHFNTAKLTETAVADLVLIVPGSINESKIDSVEKRGRRNKTEMVDESATTADEAILDLYLRHDPIGFRVRLSGFDFSCLGEGKGLLAGENMRRLIDVLKELAPNAQFVNNYAAARQALGLVWEVESRKDSKGVLRAGFGKAEFGTVASTSNLNQFTKYSRLQWHLL